MECICLASYTKIICLSRVNFGLNFSPFSLHTKHKISYNLFCIIVFRLPFPVIYYKLQTTNYQLFTMLKHLELSGFKSFAKKTTLEFNAPIVAIVGPNGSGKSNVAEAIRFVLGEQSHLSMRTKKGEDLIWNGSKSTPAMNRGAVSISFNNSEKMFKLESDLAPDLDLNFDEITLSREVYRDGTNKYLINGSQVRLRDIIELLSSVNIGASGHHIISQGEADRVLSASAKDRRIMIEESLGLKIYHWKIRESEKKLEKTTENLDKAESLRRELLPHIKFLKKQVEKIEKAEEMRTNLSELYSEYLKKEESYIAREKSKVVSEKHTAGSELDKIEKTLKEIKESLAEKGGESERALDLRKLDDELRRIRGEKDELSRKIGRVEASIDFALKEKSELEAKKGEASGKAVPLKDVEAFTRGAEELLSESDGGRTAEELKKIIDRVRKMFVDFISRHRDNEDDLTAKIEKISEELERHKEEKQGLEKSLRELGAKENEHNVSVMRIKEDADKNKDEARNRERTFYELMAKRSELSANFNVILSHEEVIKHAEAAFVEEIKEGNALIGQDILRYKQFKLDEEVFRDELRSMQEARHKEIEKLKIRLEDMGGGGGSEMLKEYKDMEEREQFLSREIEDLKKSADSLAALIKELKEKLDMQFDSGIVKINKEFEKLFALMFGGGSASISVFEEKKKMKALDPETGEEIDLEEEDGEPERGIDIKVNLPQKKIKDLAMLSGGERALTSIALLFSISQVNPPPFMVLDETDAALDEANSRKYGDMLENLSKVSQLVVITHNRETMSRAGILYGVTTGSDSVSKLLSIKFDEAVAIAK